MNLGTNLRDKHGHLFLCDLELFSRSSMVCQTKDENMHFCQLSQNLKFKVDLDTHLRDKNENLYYEIWSYFGPCLRLVKPRLKICIFFTFSELSFESGLRYPFERKTWTLFFMRFGAILALVQGWSNKG